MEEKKERQEPTSNDEEVKKDLDEILGKLVEKDEEEAPAPSEEKKSEPEKIIEKISPAAPETLEETEEEDVEEILEKITEKEEAPVEELSVVERIVNVFTYPIRLFHYLRYKPDFIIPMLITIIISVVTSSLVYDIAINDQISRIEENDRIPDEQKDMIIDSIEASKHGGKRILYNYFIPPLGVIITFSIVAAIFLFIGNVILGGKASFKHILSVYSYSYLIVAIAGTIVKLPLWLSKGTMQLVFGPAVVLSDTHSVLYQFLSAFDIFTLWFLAVFGIGFAVIYRFSQLKGILTVFITWLIYVIISKVVLGSLLMSLTG